MKVGIDLSSTNTGLVILDNNNKFIDKKVFNLWKDNKIDFDEICKLSNLIFNFWHIKSNGFEEKYEDVYIGIELADFKNANYTNRFNRICGALEFALWELPIGCDCKLFNSNEWQRFIWDINLPLIESRIITINGNKKQQFRIKSGNCWAYPQVKWDIDNWSEWLDKRGILKLLSRMWTHENCVEYRPEWTEDECDAYCIAYFLEKLRDRTQMHQEVKIRNKNKEKSKVQKWKDKANKANKIRKLEEIVNKYKFIAIAKPLTKAQQRALEKASNELEELNNESSLWI